jgi:diketogulonate reductase-like aldo/keto reductase
MEALVAAGQARSIGVSNLSANDTQMAEISAMEPQVRLLHGQFWCNPDGPYKTAADLWDE